ncbi:MAG: photosystem II stability/assembly factor-like uncharacterized protein [Glaciecola sp.]|jgi:photosystem II stability/assembly factor-like uncharacterized protein
MNNIFWKIILLLFVIFSPLKNYGQWLLVPSGTNYMIKCLYFLTPEIGYYGGGIYEGEPPGINDCFLRKTTNGGNSWFNLVSDEETPITDVHFIDETNGYSTRWLYNVMKTNDGGINWSETINKYGSNGESEMQVLDENNIVLLGAYDSIYFTNNKGNSWVTKKFPYSGIYSLSQIHFINPQIGFASSVSDLYKTDDGANSWSFSLNTNSERISFIYFVNDSIGFSMVKYRLMKTKDQGNTWYEVYNSSNTYLYAMHSRNNLLLACGPGGTIISSVDFGENWSLEEVPTSEILHDVFIMDTIAYAAGENGVLFRKYFSNNTSEIQSYSKDPSFDIAPNPVTSYLAIKSNGHKINKIDIFNCNGKIVKNINTAFDLIHVKNLPVGSYFLKIFYEKEMVVKRFLKM